LGKPNFGKFGKFGKFCVHANGSLANLVQKCKIGKSYQNKLNHFVHIKYVFCIKSDLAYKQLQNLLSTFLAFAKHQSLQRTMTATALLYLVYAKKKKYIYYATK
jgi:hypothetical protein